MNNPCPNCGEKRDSLESPCEACGWAPPRKPPPFESPEEKERALAAELDNMSYQPQFGIASILMWTTLAGLLMAVLRWAPGLGILLLIAVTPAFIRAAVQGTREKALGRELSIERKFIIFLSSFGFVIAVALSAGATFYTLCWGGVLLVASVSNNGYGAFNVGILFGIGGQIAFTIWFIVWLYRHRLDNRNRLGDVGFTLSWFGFAIIESLVILSLLDPDSYYLVGAMIWGVPALPGLICSCIAVSRPKCFLASCGVGVGIAAVALAVASLYGWRLVGNKPQKPLLLMMLVGSVAIAVIVSAGVYLGVRRINQSGVQGSS